MSMTTVIDSTFKWNTLALLDSIQIRISVEKGFMNLEFLVGVN